MNNEAANMAIRMKDIVIEFGGNTVLNGIDFSLKKGEVRGLVGKNGAGKSTLMKIINGIYTNKSGTIEFDGKPIDKHVSVKEREKYVSMIYQDYSLVGEMTVEQNIFLNTEKIKGVVIDDKSAVKKIKEFFESVNLNIDPLEKVKNLSTGDMQMVEIAKAIMKDTKVILMDEPTAALDADATENFFKIVKSLKEKGYSIIISTHHIRHIMENCDSVTVITDGKVSLDKDVADVSLMDVISAMIGGTGISMQENRRSGMKIDRSKPVIKVDGIKTKELAEEISFSVYSGEVVGLAGLKGSGRTEIMNALFGIDKITGGSFSINGKSYKSVNTGEAIKGGIFMVPENRHTQGLSLMHSVYDNALLPIIDKLAKHRIVIDDKKGKKVVADINDSLGVKTASQTISISKLSGGNQQKIVFGKALKSEPTLLLLDDPTYGVDIAAKMDIAAAMDRFTAEGNGVIYVSSELSEMIENCDRILIVKNRSITDEIDDVQSGSLTEEKLMAAIQ